MTDSKRFDMAIELPRLGLGTWQNTDPAQCAESVQNALEAGYRHIDTAQGYDNEAAVGRGIEQADVDRDDIFVATKVSTGNLAYDDVLSSTAESREKLGVDVIDLLYIHWPTNTYDPEETLAAFDELVDDGVIRHVGVSNFEPPQLEEARELLDAPIAANQIEMHALLQQDELRADAIQHDYWVVAYCPLARGTIFDHDVIADIADDHQVTPAQVALAWLLEQEQVAAIPKATGKDHILENLAATEIELSTDAIERINGLSENHRIVDFDSAPWNW